MKRKFLSILTAIAVAASLSACQAGDTRQTPPLSEAVVSEATTLEKQIVQPQSYPIPDGGWTYDSLSKCIWLNGQNVNIPIQLSDFGNDFEFEVFYQNEENTIFDIDLFFNDKYVGAARIFDETKSGNVYNGYIKSVIFSDTCPLYINGISFNSNVYDIQNFFGEVDYVSNTSCSSSLQVETDNYSQLIIRISCETNGNVENISISIDDLEE